MNASSGAVEAHSAALKKELGLGDLVLTQILYVVGSGWVGVAAKLGRPHTVFWLLAIGLFYIPLACVVIYLNRMMPLEGGLYQWAKLGFNEFAGFLVGWNLWLYIILLLSAFGLMVSTNIAYALGPEAASLGANKGFITVVTCSLVAGLTVVTTLGLGVGKWFQNLGGVAQIVTYSALLALPFLCYRKGGLEHYHPLDLAAPAISLFSLNVFGKMAMGAFSGFEYVAILAGECREPSRSIGRSVWLATPIIVLMFILGTDSILAFVRPGQVDLVGPIPQVLSMGFARLGWAGSIAGTVILLLAVRQIGASVLGIAGCTRLPMVAGWDHLLPGWFSRLHPRYGTPVNSALFVGGMTLALGLLGLTGAGHQEAFQLLENASGIFYGLTYLAMFALPLLGFRKMGIRAPWWLQGMAFCGFAVTLLYCLLSLFPVIDVPSPLWFGIKIGGVIAAANVAGVLLYAAGARRRAAVISPIPETDMRRK